jgi:Lhr-like helicase
MDKKKDITREEIEKAVNYVFNTISPERRVRLITDCKTNGLTDLSLGNVCNDPDCTACNTFHKALKDEVKRWTDTSELPTDVGVDTPSGRKWIDFNDVKNYQKFNKLMMLGHSSLEAKKIIEDEEAGQPDTD